MTPETKNFLDAIIPSEDVDALEAVDAAQQTISKSYVPLRELIYLPTGSTTYLPTENPSEAIATAQATLNQYGVKATTTVFHAMSPKTGEYQAFIRVTILKPRTRPITRQAQPAKPKDPFHHIRRQLQAERDAILSPAKSPPKSPAKVRPTDQNPPNRPKTQLSNQSG